MTPATCRSRDDWKDLLAHRLDPEVADSRETDRDCERDLEAALSHLEGCDSCRQAALAADPSLLFHPAVFRPAAQPEPTDMAAEVAAMQRAVHTMRRAERVESASTEAREGSPAALRALASRFAPGAVGRWAAALVAATSALLLGAGTWVAPAPQPVFDTAGAAPRAVAPTDFGPAVDDVLSAMPLIETTQGSVNDDPPLIFEGQETALIWVWDSDVPKDV